MAKVLEKTDGMDFGEKLKNMERRPSYIVDQKIGNPTKTDVGQC